MKKQLALLLALLFLLSGCSGSTTGGGSTSGAVGRMISEVDAGNYMDAAEIYTNSIYGNTDREYQAKQELETRLDQALSDYNTNVKSYDEAQNAITTVDRVGVLSIERVDRTQESLNALQKSKSAFESAEALFASGLYTDALENYLAVIESDINYAAAQQKAAEAREYFLADLDGELDEYIAADQYDEALALLQQARLMLPDEVSLDARETEIEAKYLNHALDQAEEIFAAGKDYEAAIRVITTAQNKLGENDRLTAALEEYQSYIPVYLNDLEYFDKSDEGGWSPTIKLSDSLEDNYGNVYSHGLGAYSPDHYLDQGSVRYYLNGNYTSLKGTLVVRKESRQSSEDGRIEIYGDGVLLYASPSMKSDTAPIDFNVDVSGVSFLSITFYPVKYERIPTLCDAILQK